MILITPCFPLEQKLLFLIATFLMYKSSLSFPLLVEKMLKDVGGAREESKQIKDILYILNILSVNTGLDVQNDSTEYIRVQEQSPYL